MENPEKFRVVTVQPSSSTELEDLGTKRKFWYKDHAGDEWLFKAEDRGTGEDWAEKITCELAALLGIPHVHYELAREAEDGQPGVVCRNCAVSPNRLILGNQLLFERDSQYPAVGGYRYGVRAHTVESTVKVLTGLALPSGEWTSETPNGITTALDVFVGYILLDAWVANQDRHHENWGAIQADTQYFLAPSFDHGGSLARNLTNDERRARLATKDQNYQIEHFARKARSAFYESREQSRAMSTMSAWASFSKCAPDAAIIWIERLRAIEAQTVETLLRRIPLERMDDVCRDFTLSLLICNQSRLLNHESD